jgi:hypothetical protein
MSITIRRKYGVYFVSVYDREGLVFCVRCDLMQLIDVKCSIVELTGVRRVYAPGLGR